MLIDPTGSVYNEIRLTKNPPSQWQKNAWIVYRIRGNDEHVKETAYLTRFIDLNPYSK